MIDGGWKTETTCSFSSRSVSFFFFNSSQTSQKFQPSPPTPLNSDTNTSNQSNNYLLLLHRTLFAYTSSLLNPTSSPFVTDPTVNKVSTHVSANPTKDIFYIYIYSEDSLGKNRAWIFINCFELYIGYHRKKKVWIFINSFELYIISYWSINLILYAIIS